MSKILIRHGLVVTMDRARRIIEDGAVAIEDDKIAAVGRTQAIEAKHEGSEAVDASGCIVMPGLICAHTHLYGILLRGATLRIRPPTDFTQNLQRIWWPVDEALTHEDAYASALAASLDSLRTGTTTVADTYSGPNSIKDVLDHIERGIDEVGIRGIISFEATERHSRDEGFRGLDENLRFIRKEKQGRVAGMISLHASFTVSDELIEKAVEMQRELGRPLTMHVCEGFGDTYHSLERYGKRTLERLYAKRFMGPRTVLAHCVNISRDELDLIRRSRTKVAHNPLSNMLNAVGVAPVREMLDAGIVVGLGNDGYIFDAFENIRAAFLIHKLHHRDPRATSPLEILEMATVKAAECYGLSHLGSLEPGKQADIVVIKPQLMPTPLTKHSVYGHLVNTVRGSDVDTVLVGGEAVLGNGKPVKANASHVSRVAQAAASRLWKRLEGLREQVDVVHLGGTG